MFRIRRIFDSVVPSNQRAISQVLEILRAQFPTARPIDFEKLPEQLTDPLKYHYRSLLLVAEDGLGKVKGFAMLLHFPDVRAVYLELISAAPKGTGGGIGGALYERVREEALALRPLGLFFECSVDDPLVIQDQAVLKNNKARLKFYERYGARPIINNDYASPVRPGDRDLYFLVYDNLGQSCPLPRTALRKIVRAVLERKYGDLLSESQIKEVVRSFRDDPAQLRASRYQKERTTTKYDIPLKPIALIVNEGHDIHHVKDRGYVEAPVRIASILHEIDKSGLFRRLNPRRMAERHIKAVHDRHFVDYLRRACASLSPTQSIYPIIFPLRNLQKPPKDIELQVGYYCMDTFTPFSSNAYKAARGAVDCALTGAEEILSDSPLAYALVRPPGHHAERRVFGGFCYFNSSAIAAHYLSQFGRVALLDLDYHHGNGSQDIFYTRDDVLTLSIHGAPPDIYPHFSGFSNERGEDAGLGFNCNYPLPFQITAERYRRTLHEAINRIRSYKPRFLVIALGLDTAKDDPTGSWPLMPADFCVNGQLVGQLKLPTLVVQEGGYRTRTLGMNARHFFEGLWEGHNHSLLQKK
ncbi:histone deacetylase family protein [Desulfuromonas thiophila]|uniref:histone deacetylase family protein n=1 Tax=Desulfuromonas thiophila TaxID=57664 RepID=UPI0029F4692C|nr:histone deacetylase family protein [Desulfuromonas thiophila]